MLGRLVRSTDEKFDGSRRLPRVPQVRVQRGEHPLLVGLRRPQERFQPRSRRREGPAHLRRLHLHSVAQRGAISHSTRSSVSEHRNEIKS